MSRVSMQAGPEPSANLDEILSEQERAWEQRPLLRCLYRDWYRLIASRLALVDGLTVELGSGIGKFKEIVSNVVLTDVAPTRWAEAVVDAEAMPYEDGSVANLVLFDVFHHLPGPRRFFTEAERALAPGGRIVLFDPYCSPVSTPAYRALHHERTDLTGDAFEDDADVGTAPFASNQARATLAFFRELREFERRWPMLDVVERRRLALLVYPMSGGFSGRQLVPPGLVRPLELLERAARFAAPALAFRCLVVIERKAGRARRQ
jgi:SAM-dependent methyltransferase